MIIQHIEQEGTQDKVGDPIKYLEMFRASKHYTEAFEKFKFGKTFIEVYAGEMRDKFEEMENCRLAIIEFAQSEKILSYEEKYYEGDKSLQEYFNLIKERMLKPDVYKDILTYDRMRAEYHDKASDCISKKFGIKKAVAVGMITIMAVDKKLESFNFASINRITRLAETL